MPWLPNSPLEEYAKHLSDARFHLNNAQHSLIKAVESAPGGHDYHGASKALSAVRKIQRWAKHNSRRR